MARDARQESDTDIVVSRRRRRKRRDSLSPQPQFPTSIRPLAPLKEPSLVLDPQLVDMPPFHSTPTASPPPLRTGLTTSAPLISDPRSVLPDGTLYPTTSSQVLT